MTLHNQDFYVSVYERVSERGGVKIPANHRRVLSPMELGVTYGCEPLDTVPGPPQEQQAFSTTEPSLQHQ